MAYAAKKTGDINVASFFFLKLLPPKNGTPAVEKKTDKKGRVYLVLHVRDCTGGGTYICNVFNNNGLADKVLALNGGKGLLESDTFLVTGSFSSYGSGSNVKKALRAANLISYGTTPAPFGIAGGGNDVAYSKMRIMAVSSAGEAVFRFSTKQGQTAVKFCIKEDTGTESNYSYACIAFGHVAEKIIGLRLYAGDLISVRGSLVRLATDNRELFKITETPVVISRAKDKEEQKKEQQTPGNKKPVMQQPAGSVILQNTVRKSSLGGRSFG